MAVPSTITKSTLCALHVPPRLQTLCKMSTTQGVIFCKQTVYQEHLDEACTPPVYLWNAPQLSQSFVAAVSTFLKHVNEVKH